MKKVKEFISVVFVIAVFVSIAVINLFVDSWWTSVKVGWWN